MIARAGVLAVLLVGAAVLAAGCVSLSPAEEESAAEIRAFADQTARVYGLPPIDLLVSRNPQSPVGTYRRGFFSVNILALTSSFRDAIVAHELAHYVLRHDTAPAAGSPEDQERERQERELDANAKAVEILMRVGGMSEERAVRTMYVYLLGAHWALERYPRMDLSGHKPPCEEIADLLARFPQQRAWTASLECAAASPRASG